MHDLAAMSYQSTADDFITVVQSELSIFDERQQKRRYIAGKKLATKMEKLLPAKK